MKIAISITSAHENATLDPRFGRASHFAIHDTDSSQTMIIENPAAFESGGAGVRAAEFIIQQGVKAVISGSFGPNAYNVLSAGGVTMYQASSGTVQELLTAQAAGELESSVNPLSVGRRHQGKRGRG